MKPGGVFAGHNYNSHEADNSQLDRKMCENGSQSFRTHFSLSTITGSIEPHAVMRAVDMFAREHNLIVTITYAEVGTSPSWVIRKPF